LGGKAREEAGAPRRTVFFYGSFMDEELLEGAGVVANDVRAGVLWGYEIRITSAATLVRSDRECCYGVVCVIASNNLDRLSTPNRGRETARQTQSSPAPAIQAMCSCRCACEVIFRQVKSASTELTANIYVEGDREKPVDAHRPAQQLTCRPADRDQVLSDSPRNRSWSLVGQRGIRYEGHLVLIYVGCSIWG
jgi:hypothetical protein